MTSKVTFMQWRGFVIFLPLLLDLLIQGQTQGGVRGYIISKILLVFKITHEFNRKKGSPPLYTLYILLPLWADDPKEKSLP